MSEIKTPYIEKTKNPETKTETGKLKAEIENKNKNKPHSIEDLKITEKDKPLKDIINWFNMYFESELKDLWLNKNQKDNIKLVLISEIMDKLNWNKEINISKSLQKLISKIPDFLKAKKSEENSESSKIKKFLDWLWLSNIKKSIDLKIAEIKKEKNKESFNKLDWSFKKLWLKEKNFSDIQEQLNQANKNSIKVSEALDTIQDWAKKLWIWNILKDILKYLSKSFPFLAAIFGSFLDQSENWENSEKTKKSNLHLVELLKNEEKSPLKKIEKNWNFKNKEKLNPEKLKKFYKYLDSKWIDYSKENFWEEFLSWKSKDTKIIKLHNLFNSTQDNKWTQFKYIWLEKFIETLNNLPERENKINNKKEKEELEKTNKKVNSEITKLKEKINSTTNKVEKEKIKKQIKIKESEKKLSFEEYLKQWKIVINWKLENISSENNKMIKIWNKNYKIEINWTWFWAIAWNLFEWISMNNWNLTIKANWKIVTYSIEKAKPLIKELIANNWINNKKINWKPATLSITQSS